jgi:hypothetical protein
VTALTYTPPPSVRGFLTSDKFISLICGPVGSTKTTGAIMKIAYHASKMACSRDGVRRSRAIWVRNTREQLRDTSIPDVLKWFPDGQAGLYLKSEYKFILRFNDVECEILFRGLDDANDVRRLLSLQASFGVLDEFREIHPTIFENIQGRLGRYPDKMMVPHRPTWGLDSQGNPVAGCVTDDGKPNARLWGASNPPDMDTFWEDFLSDPPANASVFMQPSGLAPEADWRQYLPDSYYENLAEGKNQDWVDVYIHAKFGKSLAGSPVHQGFQRDYHVAKQPLTPIRSSDYPLLIGMDFGLNPSVTLNQLDPRGRFLTFADATSDGMGALRFIQTKLKPLLANKFAGLPVLIIGDPAGQQRVQTDERSVFDILRQEGFKVIPARTNATAARVAAVDGWLARQVDGGPAHLVDPSCETLIHALRSGYRYKRKRDGELEPTPEKNLSSHIAEAHQYAALHAGGPSLAGGVLTQRREVKRSSSGGWT